MARRRAKASKPPPISRHTSRHGRPRFSPISRRTTRSQSGNEQAADIHAMFDNSDDEALQPSAQRTTASDDTSHAPPRVATSPHLDVLVASEASTVAAIPASVSTPVEVGSAAELAAVPDMTDPTARSINSSSGGEVFLNLANTPTPTNPTVKQTRDGRTKVYYQGYTYTRSNATGVKISYRCSSYRKKCKARFAFMGDTATYDFSELVPHTCRQRAPLISGPTMEGSNHCADVSEAILEEVDKLAVETNKTQAAIWNHVLETIYMQPGPPVRGLSKNAVENRVKYVRGKQSGGNRNRSIEMPPMSKVQGSQQGFFQFQYSWHDDIKAQKDSVGVERVIGWSHPLLRNLLRFENLSWFIDGTFRAAPTGYKQCVTIMVLDPSSELYIPVIFSLAASMTAGAYLKLLQCVEDCVGKPLVPKEVVCDFEKALIGAIRQYFPEVRIIGCLFHFKQACRRKLKTYGMPKLEAKLAMAPSVFDILTVIDPSKIKVQGIAWVKAKIKRSCEAKRILYSRKKWRLFWNYFRSTWLVLFPPTFWNVYGMRREVVSRTNNPLERFHRHLNSKIQAPHPSLNRLVTVLESLSREYTNQRTAVLSGLAQPPQRARFQLPRAPALPNEADVVESDTSGDEEEQGTTGAEQIASDSSDVSSEDDDTDEIEEDREGSEPDNSFDYDGGDVVGS